MNKESKEILFKCLNRLIDGLNNDCLQRNISNNCFEEIKGELPNNIDFDYNFIYVYLITILLNNRSFFKNKFSKLPWEIPLHRFDSNSTINGYLALEYGRKEELTEQEIEEYEKAEFLSDPAYSDEYQDYINKKYKDSMYEPDDQESIIFEEKYNFDHGIDYNPDEYNNEFLDALVEAEYNDALATLPAMLKNKDKPNINMIIQCIRNALAHNHFNFTDNGLSMYSIDNVTGKKNFECVISNVDMVEILEKYIGMVFNEKEMIKTPYIMYLMFNDIGDREDTLIYDEFKDILSNEFKSLNLENEFSKLLNEVERIINENRNKYLEDYDSEEDLSEDEYLNFDRKNILINLVKKYFLENNTAISSECKLFEVLFVLESFNKELEENWYDVYKAYDFDSSNIVNFDGLEYIVYTKFPWLYTIDIPVEVKSFLSKIVVLLNLLFVQCSYDDVDKNQIDLSMMKINDDYIEEKNEIFSSKIDKIRDKCDKSIEKIEGLSIAIKTGRASSEKQELLAIMKNDLSRMKSNIDKIKNDWKLAINFDNSSIINHIRNSFAHGSYTIQIPENSMDLKSFNIVIKDYEPGSNKVSFSGTISIYDILTQVLKPEVISQLFDLGSREK